jgi:hypothetical protein
LRQSGNIGRRQRQKEENFVYHMLLRRRGRGAERPEYKSTIHLFELLS